MLLAAVYELSTVRPHERDGRGFTRVEWPIYSEGYYAALGAALQVLELTARTFNEREQRRRDAASGLLVTKGAA